jgi:hypothetical protein
MSLKVSFTNFWPGFDNESNFFLYVISRSTTRSIEVVEVADADLVITSCFPDKKVPKIPKSRNGKINWFYSGENLRPNFETFHANFSFDYSVRSNAFRLPLWWMYLDWTLEPNSPHFDESRINPYVLHLPREVKRVPQNTISAFIGNMTNLRRSTIERMPQLFEFSGFGSAFKNPSPSKIAFIGTFGYNLCFENSYFPGYHTEKLLQAWVMESIPLYFGAKTVSLDFQAQCFINLAEHANIEDFWRSVSELTDHRKMSILNSPLVKEPLKLDALTRFIRNHLPV